MHRMDWRNAYTALLVIALIVLASALRVLHLISDFYFLQFESLVIYTIYIGLLAAWGVSLVRRIMQKNILRYLLLTVGLLIFWVMIRTVKFKFTADHSTLERFFWYSYYIPMILIPLIGFYIVVCLGNDEYSRPDHKYFFLLVPAFALILLVLSNDWHQLVFRFLPDLASYAGDYVHEPLYLLISAWVVFFSVADMVLIARKSYIQRPHRRLLAPFFFIAVGVIYSCFYIVYDFRFIEMTAMFGLLIAGVWESCIRSGLIPSNTGYRLIVNHSMLDVQLYDTAGKRHFGTQASFLDADDFAHIRKTGYLRQDDSWAYHAASIQGGYVVWREDVAALIASQNKLSEYRDARAENNLLIQKEIDSGAEAARIREKTRLFTLISEQTLKQQHAIQEHLDGLSAPSPEARRKTLCEILVLATFIKRRGNLLLLQEEVCMVSTTELELSVQEVLHVLANCGMAGEARFEEESVMTSARLNLAFLFFEQVLEHHWYRITGIRVRLTGGPDEFYFTVECEVSEAKAGEANADEVTTAPRAAWLAPWMAEHAIPLACRLQTVKTKAGWTTYTLVIPKEVSP